MTWPQYLRRECNVTARLSRREAELLATLLMRHPGPVSTSDLIEALYPDPDSEPEFPESEVRRVVSRLRAKVGRNHIVQARSGGYRLNWR